MNNAPQQRTALTEETLSEIIEQYIIAEDAAKVIRAIQGMPEPAPETTPPRSWADAFSDVLTSLICAGAIVAIIWGLRH